MHEISQSRLYNALCSAIDPGRARPCICCGFRKDESATGFTCPAPLLMKELKLSNVLHASPANQEGITFYLKTADINEFLSDKLPSMKLLLRECPQAFAFEHPQGNRYNRLIVEICNFCYKDFEIRKKFYFEGQTTTFFDEFNIIQEMHISKSLERYKKRQRYKYNKFIQDQLQEHYAMVMKENKELKRVLEQNNVYTFP